MRSGDGLRRGCWWFGCGLPLFWVCRCLVACRTRILPRLPSFVSLSCSLCLPCVSSRSTRLPWSLLFCLSIRRPSVLTISIPPLFPLCILNSNLISLCVHERADGYHSGTSIPSYGQVLGAISGPTTRRVRHDPRFPSCQFPGTKRHTPSGTQSSLLAGSLSPSA